MTSVTTTFTVAVEVLKEKKWLNVRGTILILNSVKWSFWHFSIWKEFHAYASSLAFQKIKIKKMKHPVIFKHFKKKKKTRKANDDIKGQTSSWARQLFPGGLLLRKQFYLVYILWLGSLCLCYMYPFVPEMYHPFCFYHIFFIV